MMQRGYIAVLATLIIGAVSLAAVVGVLSLGIGSQQNMTASQWSTQARHAVDACGEEGLLQIQQNTNYTGTGNLTIAGRSCSYTVASTGASTRTISATATVGNVVRKIMVYVTIGSSSISVTSWQEVAS